MIKKKVYNLLHWLERIIKIDMIYLAESSFWLFCGQIVSSVSAFLLSIAFANLLPKETYGIYKYVLSIASILTIPTLSGMNTAITQAVAKGHEAQFIPALKVKIKWGLLGGLLSLILAGYFYLTNDFTLTISFLISSLFLPFMDSFGIYDALLQGRGLFNISTKYFIISQIISIVSMIGILFLTRNIFLILFTYFISWTLLRIIFFKKTLKEFPLNNVGGASTISYGKHLSAMNITNAIAAQLDKILIFHYLGATEVAIYTFAIAIPEQIKGFLKNINILALLKFSKQSTTEIQKNIIAKMLKGGGLVIFIIIIYLVAAPTIYRVFFPQYPESVLLSEIFSISLITTILLLPYSALQAKQAQRELYFLNIWTSVVQIISSILFIYFWGLMGAILAKILSRFFNLALSTYLIINKKDLTVEKSPY